MANQRQNFIVELQPIGRRAELSPEETLLAAAQSVGVELQAVCGGVGTCGQCKVRLTSGSLSAPTSQEREKLGPELLETGCRLACQAMPASHVTLEIPPESLTSSQRVQLDGLDLGVSLDPLVVPFDLTVDASLPGKLRKTINEAAGPDVQPGAESFEKLAARAQGFARHVRLAVNKESSPFTIVGVFPEKTRIFGLAVDLGTTKVASYLVDLETGKTVAQRGLMNPQIAYGEDVISRISYASHSGGAAQQLQRKVIETLNQMVREFCSDRAISPEQIVEMVVAGNTAMHHFFAGLPVQQLGMAPYLPATTEPLHLTASDLGVEIAPGASIYTPPNIAGYVGGDHVAMLIGIGAGSRKSGPPFLAIDIGTNTEITLSVHGRLLTCSCASGPAFEGAHIRHGMRAAPGAIERVLFERGVIQTYTIERRLPIGICASGILDAIAALLDAGVLESRGNFRKGAERVRQNGGGGEFLLVSAENSGSGGEIVLTRQDISEIQFAKAAIRAGIEVLLEVGGVDASALEEFIIAGAFGSYLDVQSAVRIGLFPQIPLGRFRQVGNAAGIGARQMLISGPQRRLGESLVKQVEYVELATHPHFQDKFAQSLFF
ncbi:MAG: ASKHA domain-containing protein [Candidatus Acidiferrales bacterium]